MQIRIVAVGKIKEKFLQDGIAEYEKRLRPYAKVQIVEIPEEKRPASASASMEKAAMEKEGERILAAIPDGSFVIALDVKGQGWSSEELAESFRRLGTGRAEPAGVCDWRGSRAFPGRPCPERPSALALPHDLHPPDGPAPSR